MEKQILRYVKMPCDFKKSLEYVYGMSVSKLNSHPQFWVLYLGVNNGEDVIQSLSWNYEGTCIATTCRDKKVRITDPRANVVTQTADNHSSNRESKAIWIDSNRILTSGFDSVSPLPTFLLILLVYYLTG